jgi:hypothetical protein
MRNLLLGAVATMLALAPTASAERTASLAAGRPIVLAGEVSGAATYGPIVPTSGQALPEECFADGCEEHAVRVVVPRGHVAVINWTIEAPATGAGLDLRIFDDQNQKVSIRNGGGGAATTTPSSSTYGSSRQLSGGVYTVRASVVGGSTEYKATLALRLHRTK